MAIAYRSVASVASASRTTTTVNMPAGAAAGDEVRIFVGAGHGSSTAPVITPPGAVTLVTTVVYSNSDPWSVRISEYRYRVVGSGDPASFAFTTSTAFTEAVAVAFSGVDATTPDDATPTTTASSTGTTATFTGLTVVTNGAALLGVRGSWDGTAITPPASWTETLDQPVTWLGHRIGMAPGATGDITISAGNGGGSNPWGTILSVLRPAGSSSPVTVSPSGIATSEAIGTATVQTTVTVAPSGIATGAATGTPGITATITVAPGGITTGAALGAPGVQTAVTVAPTGIASGEALGAPVVSNGALMVAPTGIASGAALGDVTAQTSVTIAPGGVPSLAAVGTPAASTTITATPTGMATGSALGTPVVSMAVIVTPAGIASAAALGTPAVTFPGASAERHTPWTLTITTPGERTAALSPTPDRDLTVTTPPDWDTAVTTSARTLELDI